MKWIIRVSIVSIVLAIPLMLSYAKPAAAASNLIGGNSTAQACAGINLDQQGTDACSTYGPSSLNGLLTTIVNLLSTIVGAIAVIMVIVGGIKYATSGGEASAVGEAKSTILYALIALVIVAFAQILVSFVLNKATTAANGKTGIVLLLPLERSRFVWYK